MDKYQAWIDANCPDPKLTLGRCKQFALKMKEAFPELRVTNGFVTLLLYDEALTHWWCVTPDGVIVDPTAGQYIWNGTPIAEYEEITDDHDERRFPKVKCMECGEYYYVKPELNGTMHTKACESAFIADLNERCP